MLLKTTIIILFFALTSNAYAYLEFCNRTNKKIQLAIISKDSENKWISSGWYSYAPSECAKLISEPLPNRYYYYYAKRSDGAIWSGTSKQNHASGCIRNSAFEIDQSEECEKHNASEVLFRRIDTGQADEWTIDITHEKETLKFDKTSTIEKACSLIHSQLQRPKLRPQKFVIGHYTDIFTVPKTKSECTNVYDTGVPDLSTCTTSYDECASKWHGPFGSWGCVPGTTTQCSNIKSCDTYANYKKTMECDVTLQMKLPNFIEQPLEKFIDNSFEVIEETRSQIATSIPIACASREIRSNASNDLGQAFASSVAKMVERRVRSAIEKEIREWVQETAIETIAASIPSGGIGGAAAMGTSIGNFIYKAHKAIEPIINLSNDTKNFAEDLGFSTSCGWSDWHTW